jgi:hypothetical protein
MGLCERDTDWVCTTVKAERNSGGFIVAKFLNLVATNIGASLALHFADPTFLEASCNLKA